MHRLGTSNALCLMFCCKAMICPLWRIVRNVTQLHESSLTVARMIQPMNNISVFLPRRSVDI